MEDWIHIFERKKNFSVEKSHITTVCCKCHSNVSAGIKLQNDSRTSTHICMFWMVECITKIMDYSNTLMDA